VPWRPAVWIGGATRSRRRVAGEMKRYRYPRFVVSNKSLDILGLCWAALGRLGVAHRRPSWDQVSVARREAVTALDVWLGPRPDVFFTDR
jgi:hypothetical protein